MVSSVMDSITVISHNTKLFKRIVAHFVGMGSYTTDQFHNYFDQNLNGAWFGTTSESNTFQQDQSYCSLRHNAPDVNDLDQNCHSQWTSPFPGCGVPINNLGAMNGSVYDYSSTHYHYNKVSSK